MRQFYNFKSKLISCMFFIGLFFNNSIHAQINIFNDNFETGVFSASWTIVNDATNQWVVGTAQKQAGTYGAYISNDGGTTSNYTNTSAQISHIYTDIVIPVLDPKLVYEARLSFNWLCNGEDVKDYGAVYITDVANTPVAGAVFNNGMLLSNLRGLTSWQTANILLDLSKLSGQTKRLVFSWKNDAAAGANAAFSIDNPTLFYYPHVGFNSVTPAQINRTIGQGVQNAQIINLNIKVSAPVIINQFDFSLAGCTNPSDVVKARLFYGQIDAALPIAEVNVTGNTIVFDNINHKPGNITNGNNMYYLCLDLAPAATLGNAIDASCTNLTLLRDGMKVNLPQTLNPAGYRKVVAPYTGTITVGAGMTLVTFKAMIDSLNDRGVGTGGVTFELQDDQLFTASYLWYIYQTGTSTDPLIFKRSGTGAAKPIINIPSSGSTSDAAFQMVGSDYVTFDGLDIRGPYAAGQPVEAGIAFQGRMANGCQYNTVKNTSITLDIASTNTGAGISISQTNTKDVTGTNSYNKFYGNTIQNCNFGVSFQWNAGKTNFPDEGNEVGDAASSNIMTGIKQVGVYARNQKNIKIFNNDISTGTISYSISTVGIDIYSTGPAYIYNNKIHNINNTVASGAYYISGINGNADLTYIYNNLIYDLSMPNATNDGATRGINVGQYLKTYLYYNTIYLAFTNTNATSGHYGIMTDYNSSLIETRNNVVVLNITNGGAAKVCAFQARVLNSLTANSDYNLYYAGTPGAKNLIFDGNGTYQTLAAYKLAGGLSPREQHSYTENPTFIDAANGDLHINTVTPTVIESGGGPVAMVLNDIEGSVRNTDNPDLGAYEGTYTASDLTGPTIAFTPIVNQTAAAAPVLSSVTISDPSGVNVIAGTKPRLYYKKSSDANAWGANTSAFNGWKYVEANEAASPFSFSIDYTIINGGAGTVINNTTIQYFVIAQDNIATPNVYSNYPNGMVATSVAAITTAPTTLYSYKVFLTPLNGTYYIGVGQIAPNYTTLANAINDLNIKYVSGPVTFLLKDATYDLAAAGVGIGEISGASATNTITLKPDAGVSSTIRSSVGGSIIQLNGTDYFILDGSNTAGGITKDLTIESYNALAAGGNPACVALYGQGIGKGATYNVIKNCIFTGITPVPAAPAITCYGVTLNNQDNDNNTIQNNTFKKIGTAINANSSSDALNDNLVIDKNLIDLESVVNNALFRNGIVVSRVNNCSITNNTIQNAETCNSNADLSGIYCSGELYNLTITGNIIKGVVQNGSIDRTIRGITVSPSVINNNVLLANNMLSNILGNIATNGIELGGSLSLCNVYNNTVNLYGDKSSYVTSGTANGIHSVLRITSWAVNQINIINNIFVNSIKTNNAGPRTHKSYIYYVQSPYYPVLLTQSVIDNNALYIDNSPNGFIGYRDYNTDYLLYKDWQSYTGYDKNSYFENVPFVSPSDLHINPAVATNVMGRAIAIPALTTDIDGDARDASFPDIGADESAATPAISPTKSIITLSANKAPINATDYITITLQAKDNTGNNIATGGGTISFFINDLPALCFGTISSVTDNANGTYTATLTGTRLGAGNSVYAIINTITSASFANFIVTAEIPTAAAASGIMANAFSASWTQSPSATGYEVEVATDAGFTSLVSGYNPNVIAAGTTITLNVSGLTAGTQYYYRVRSTVSGVASNNSNVINLITLPGKPGALAATAITASGFTANWNTITGVTGYQLEVSKSNTFAVLETGYPASTVANTYNAISLSAHTTYYYRIVGVNASGNSDYSDTISLKTLNTLPAVAANALYTLDEDSIVAIDKVDLGFADGDGDTLVKIKISTAPAKGTLFVDINGNNVADAGEVLVSGDSVLVANIDSIKFRPVANENGAAYTNMKVSASDGYGYSMGDCIIAFDVDAVNDKPVFSIDKTTISVNEDFSTTETITVTPGLVPADESAQVVAYSLIPASVTFANVSINASSGAVTITAKADSSGTQLFKIVANDAQALFNTDTLSFTLTVASVNDAPAFTISSATVTADEDFATTETITVTPVSVPANESAQIVTYSIEPASVNYANVSVNTSNGTVTITAKADSFGTSVIKIIADDGQALNDTSSKSFTLTVNAVNDQPSDISISNVTIAEKQPMGSKIGYFTSTDVDKAQIYTYTLVTGAGDTDNASFTIDGDSLKSAAIFDYNTQTSYAVRIRTTDNGAPAQNFEKQFTITIVQVNVAPTDISMSSDTVQENAIVNTFIGKLSTTDANIGQSFSYSMVSGTGSTDNNLFVISNDSLKLSAAIDFESKPTCSVRIRSTDNGLPTAMNFEKVFTITVKNVNEIPATLTLTPDTIQENKAIGTLVGVLGASDPDAGDVLTYTLVSGAGDSDNASFAISIGNLNSAAIFDYETKNSYSIRVKAADTKGLSIEQSVTVTITDLLEVGLNGIKNQTITAYPIPTRDKVTIVLSESSLNGTLKLFDLSGKLILTRNITTYPIILDLGSMPAAVYIIEISKSDYTESIRVIKE